MNEIFGSNIVSNHGSLKNGDCYFYYYSTCNKGDSCPYRHEPAALRSETVCLYWLKGSCNKSMCIYRHMDIKKNRNRIQCFFENQPGGCKKLHCPFLHENVQDQPRDEDVARNPELILPVKGSEMEYDSSSSKLKKMEENIANQLKFHRKQSNKNESSNSRAGSSSPHTTSIFPSITHESFIVSLHDDDSDSEIESSSLKGKKSPKKRRLSSENNWELERLKQIQAEEGVLLGYSIASDEGSKEVAPSSRSSSPSVVINPTISTSLPVVSTGCLEEEYNDNNSSSRLDSAAPSTLSNQYSNTTADSELDSMNYRATLKSIGKILGNSSNDEENVLFDNDANFTSSNDFRSSVSLKLVKSSSLDYGVSHDKSRLSPVPLDKFVKNDGQTIPSYNTQRIIVPIIRYSSKDMSSKSLDEVIALSGDKFRTKSHRTVPKFTGEHIRSPFNGPTDPNVLKIKTLSEIKAERHNRTNRVNCHKKSSDFMKKSRSVPRMKRSISPITFDSETKSKKLLICFQKLRN